MNKTFDKVDHHQKMTDQAIARMEEAEKLKWEIPWFKVSTRPYNLETGTRFKGCNLFSTALSEFSDNRWLTFNGIQSYAKRKKLDLRLKKGSVGAPIFKALQKEFTKDKTGEELDQARKLIFMVKAGTVFNAEQIDGMPPEIIQTRTFDPIFAAEVYREALVAKTGLKIIQTKNGAWYNPSNHTVGMYSKEHAKSEMSWYDTFNHESIHSSGPQLGRKMKGQFGSMDYAEEELVAELGSVFLAYELGIEHDQYAHDQHAAYLKCWLSKLQDDKNFIFKASNAASRATIYQMENLREHLYDLSQSNSATPEHKNLAEYLGQPARILKAQEEQKVKEEQAISTLMTPSAQISSQVQKNRPAMSM